MSNHHLRNKELTLKAKGLLSQMLSLPENWDYTLAGLSHINKESIDAIRTAVLELEKAGYIERAQGRDEKGKMTAITYTIYEQPQSPVLENPTSNKPTSENPMQLNKDIQKTDLSKKEKINKNGLNTYSIPILSPDPSPLSQQPLPEKNGKEEKDAYKIYEELIKDNIEYGHLINTKRLDRDRIDEILDLILETVCSKRKGDGEKAAEDFWTKSERLFYCALIGYIFYEAPEEERILPTFTNRKRCNLKKITMLLSSNFILSCVGAFIALCFDFLNLFCSSGNYSGSLVADFEQAIKPSALR